MRHPARLCPICLVALVLALVIGFGLPVAQPDHGSARGLPMASAAFAPTQTL